MAVQFLLPLGVTVITGFVPVHPTAELLVVQPTNTEPAAAAAVKVMELVATKQSTPPFPQLMPVPETLPTPVPAMMTVMVLASVKAPDSLTPESWPVAV